MLYQSKPKPANDWICVFKKNLHVHGVDEDWCFTDLHGQHASVWGVSKGGTLIKIKILLLAHHPL